MNKQEPKHTPGPWFPIEYAGFWDLAQNPNYSDYSLLNEDNYGEEAQANAKLAAAAPDLLEALIEIIRISDRKHNAWDKGKEAIKKATE